jgi:hypothetical protein
MKGDAKQNTKCCLAGRLRRKRTLGSAKTESKHACQVCGMLISAADDLCPVCALRGALSAGHDVSDSPPSLSELRFEHYEVQTRADGQPFELGRGAMGVTYKALDINLRCPLALKVINARFIGDESARRRFLREGSRCGQRAPSERRFGVSPREEWRQLLLCDGVC